MEERGWFWIEGGEENRVRGVFSAEDGKKPEATLEGEVVDDPRLTVTHTAAGETSVAISGVPAKIAEAFAPVVLHGQLDSGEPVTLLRAQNHGGPGFLSPPHYIAPVAVVGAHVSEDQLYSAVRFQLNAPAWTYHLANGAEHRVADHSLLRAESSDEGTWLVYEPSQPISRPGLDKRVLIGCRTLARLALDPKVGIQAAEIRIPEGQGDGGEWKQLHNPALNEPALRNVRPLLPPEELTVERFARWLDLNDKLDGLAAAVSIDASGEAQALTFATLVEGLHRRLPYPELRFPDSSKTALEKVKKAARQAAADRAKDLTGLDRESVHAAVKDAVGHLEEVGYRTRAQDIVSQVINAVPELVESIPDLPGALTNVRNDLAHHLIPDEAKEPYANRINLWIVISYATPWLLRLLLLLQAGVEPDVLHRACLEDQRFGFYRANVADVARDLGWLPRSTEP